MLASEYGWTAQYIMYGLTFEQIESLISAIAKRRKAMYGGGGRSGMPRMGKTVERPIGDLGKHVPIQDI